jgi:hypothetical protein
MPTFELFITDSPTIAVLEEYLTHLIMERTSELDKKLIRKNPEYLSLRFELEEYCAELRRLAPESLPGESFIEKLQVAISRLEILVQRFSYRQGL